LLLSLVAVAMVVEFMILVTVIAIPCWYFVTNQYLDCGNCILVE